MHRMAIARVGRRELRNVIRASTFSITAGCPRTGQLGVAVATAVPCVGALVPYVKSGVGAVATQSWVNPYIGIWGLELLGEGLRASEVVQRLADRDPEPALRQFAVVDAYGDAMAYTGEKCDSWCGHLTGDGYVVAGNMLVGPRVIEAMAREFESRADAPLAERLLAALEAGQHEGGDKRGKVSAALYVVHTEEYPFVDIRVDDHGDPVAELRRIYEVFKQKLLPLMESLPTKANPRGQFDFEAMRAKGILQDRWPGDVLDCK